MALTGPQKVTVAEITRETYARIDSLASSLNSDQETVIIADIATWNLNRNDVDLEFKGDGFDLKTQRLLDAIRVRTRRALGLSAGLVAAGVFAGGISKADATTRDADTDRVSPMFTANLHQSDL